MSPASHSAAHFADCGLPGITLIPYGVHMCFFYESREDLAGALVPYFAAGLRGNERCIWVTADPLPAAEAKRALREAGVDVDAALRKGSLAVRDYAEWYGDWERVSADDLVEHCLREERNALSAGYDAVRLSGNISFVTPERWSAFMEYEQTLNQALLGRRIVGLCSYPLGRSPASDVLEVVRRHHCTLDHPDHGWQILSGRPG